MLIFISSTSHGVEVFHPNFFRFVGKSCDVCVDCVCMCLSERLCVYIPGGADRGDGGGSQGDAVQTALLQQ